PFAPSSPRRFRSIRARVCARAPWEFMARVGVSEFYSSLQGPRDRQQTWRETIARMNYWDHPFHPLNERPPEPSYKGLSTSSGGDLRQPWELLALSRRHVGPLDMRDTYLGGTGTRMKCSSYHGRASASSGASSHRLGTQRGGQDTAAFASSFNDRTLKASASCGALPWRQRLDVAAGTAPGLASAPVVHHRPPAGRTVPPGGARGASPPRGAALRASRGC
ncbi:unnamed protein product, partial [Prorocentrum cordatum]